MSMNMNKFCLLLYHGDIKHKKHIGIKIQKIR